MRLLIALVLAVLLAACHPRGAGNHENVGANADAIQAYADENYDLTLKWPVYFSVLVDGEADAKGLAQALTGEGYTVEYGEQGGGIWWVEAVTEFVPTVAAMDTHENAVVALSDKFDGYYEGWELEEGVEAQDAESVAETEE